MTQRIGFGGGCHWCTEAVFQSVTDVAHVEQGWIASSPPNDTESEAVIVHFDPQKIPLIDLVRIHLHTHSSTSPHAMRRKYRSAIYSFDSDQADQAQAALNELQADFDAILVTRVMPFASFRASDQRYQDYYRSNPDRPFCQTYIAPKLQRARSLTTEKAN